MNWTDAVCRMVSHSMSGSSLAVASAGVLRRLAFDSTTVASNLRFNAAQSCKAANSFLHSCFRLTAKVLLARCKAILASPYPGRRAAYSPPPAAEQACCARLPVGVPLPAAVSSVWPQSIREEAYWISCALFHVHLWSCWRWKRRDRVSIDRDALKGGHVLFGRAV